MKTNQSLMLVLSLCLSIVGCESKTNVEKAIDTTEAAQPSEVSTPAVQCPPAVQTPAIAAGLPKHDVVGIELGMSFSDVEAILACREPAPELFIGEAPYLRTQTHDIELRSSIRSFTGPKDPECVRNEYKYAFGAATGAAPRCEKGYRTANPDRMHIVFTGLPGKEQVRAVWRSRHFEDDKQPTIESLQTALREKYGEPHYIDRETWVWSYDLLNRPMSDKHKRVNACRSHPRELIDSSTHVLGDCGLTIRALVSAGSNALLAQRFRIVVMHHKAFVDAQTEFQQALNTEKQRRDAEALDEAGKNAVSTGDL